MAFINSLLSYLLVVIVFAAVAGIGVVLGIVMRKRKNIQTEAEGGSAAGTEE